MSQTKTLLVSYPDVLAATAGGLLLVGVGISSARAARRRLRYETWYYLHFYTYLAIALAFSHQFAVGAEFMTNTAARVAWGTVYAGVGAAIVWYRFVTPVRQALRHQLRVVAVQPETAGVVSIVIGGRQLGELRAESGQFFRWRFLTRGLWWVSSPYSLSAPPGRDRLCITVKALGDHSEALDDAVFRRELEQLAANRRAKLWFVAGTRADLGGDPLTAAALSARISGLAKHDVEYPQQSPRDEQINAYAIPALNQEALTAGSAKIDTISGATYTSSTPAPAPRPQDSPA